MKRKSVSGDWVVAINVGMIDCQARHGAAAWRWTAQTKTQREMRTSEPLDDTKSEGNDSFESVAQCARMHTALPHYQAEVRPSLYVVN